MLTFTQPATGITTTNVPALKMVLGIGLFIAILDPAWTFPHYVNWDLEFATSPDGGSWSSWQYRTSITDSYYYFHDPNPTMYHQFRYRINTKNGSTDWSPPTTVGQPKIVNLTPAFVPVSTSVNSPATIYVIEEFS